MTRSDKVVNLSKIDLTVDSIREKRNIQHIFETSTNPKDFSKNIFTKAELMQYIIKMCKEEQMKNEDERVDINESLPKITANKDCIVAFLVKWRRRVFAKNVTKKEELLQKINNEFANRGLSTKAARTELLRDNFFMLSESIRRDPRYTEVATITIP